MSSGSEKPGVESESAPIEHNETVQDRKGDSFTARHFFMRSSQVPRSDGSKPQLCRCCPGGDHRFCGGLRIEPPMDNPYSGRHDLAIDGWLDLWVYRNARYEGRLIRVTLEVLDDPIAPVALMPVVE